MNGYADSGGFFYCKDCVDSLELADMEEVDEKYHDHFTPCVQCQDDTFGRDIETDFVAIDTTNHA